MTAWCLPAGNAARRARELFRDQLAKLPLAADVLDELEIVVSELVTNATRYAPGPYELRLLHHHGLPVRAEVVDAGAGTTLIEHLLHRPPPIPERLDDLELGGRGLRHRHRTHPRPLRHPMDPPVRHRPTRHRCLVRPPHPTPTALTSPTSG
ncbi:ATP-binding protein [Streptosporangium sp. CA-115845]|uniref:ATP-binding protein n=1 Tax=Streptosporangium sp. CA-115845 TaxID=3240071 RepID=UPI003D8EB473